MGFLIAKNLLRNKNFVNYCDLEYGYRLPTLKIMSDEELCQLALEFIFSPFCTVKDVKYIRNYVCELL